MTYDPKKHHRRSIRLQSHNYAQPNAYYITICTKERKEVFGRIVNGEMHFNDVGVNTSSTTRHAGKKMNSILKEGF